MSGKNGSRFTMICILLLRFTSTDPTVDVLWSYDYAKKGVLDVVELLWKVLSEASEPSVCDLSVFMFFYCYLYFIFICLLNVYVYVNVNVLLNVNVCVLSNFNVFILLNLPWSVVFAGIFFFLVDCGGGFDF